MTSETSSIQPPAPPQTLPWVLKLREWAQPAVIVAALALFAVFEQISAASIEGRLAGIERRTEALDDKLDQVSDRIRDEIRQSNLRIDRVLEQQSSVAGQIGRVEAELGYLRTRIDGVANRLQVSAAPVPPTPAPPAPIANLPRDSDVTGALPLDSRQQDLVRRFAEKNSVQTGATTTAFISVAPGATLPLNVQTFTFPPEVTQEVPSLRNRVYAKTEGGLAIVDLNDRRVLQVVR